MTMKVVDLEGAVRLILRAIRDPYLGIDLEKANILKEVFLKEGKFCVRLRFGYPFESAIVQQIQSEIQALDFHEPIEIQVDWKINRHQAQNGLKAVSGVKNIIAVGSCKGGVGKSTTAINLALAMQTQGAKVGLLDADIYGPNQPLLLGIKEKPTVRVDKRFEPVVKYGLQTMSMGYLLEEEAPLVWRGPMISRAFEQMVHETVWDALDYLIIDLPPGTGDIQLTLAQKVPVCGAVIVTTPQEIALLDVRKAVAMFKKVKIPVLGVVENMGVHICSQCGAEEFIFGAEGGEKLSLKQELSFLGRLPLDRQIREQADKGEPIVISDPTGPIANLYQEIARCVSAKLSLEARDYTAISPVVV